MKKCKSCKTEIDSKATKCPHCQADQRNWFRRHPIWTIVLIFFIILGVTSAGSNGSEKTSQSTNATSKGMVSGTENDEPSESMEAIIVDAKAFVGEYDKNKLTAEEKYKGKLIQTTATIKNISGGDFGDYYLSLEPGNEEYYFGTTIQCFFKDKNELTSLSNNEPVTVKGTAQDMAIGTVILKNCSVVK